MAITPATFLDDLQKFTAESLRWCAQESEREAGHIADVLNELMTDANRRGNMPQETLKALADIQKRFLELGTRAKTRREFHDLATALRQIGAGDSAIGQLTSPIIEALQFQDRLRQNIENLGKMISVWVKTRVDATATKSVIDPLEFGRALLACTTSTDEREIVRGLIPGLPEEQKVETALFF